MTLLIFFLFQVDLIHSWMNRIIAKLRVICAKVRFLSACQFVPFCLNSELLCLSLLAELYAGDVF